MSELITNCTVIDRQYGNRRVRGQLCAHEWFGFSVLFKPADIVYRMPDFSMTSQSIQCPGIESEWIIPDDSVIEITVVKEIDTPEGVERITTIHPVSDFTWYQECEEW